MATDPEKKKGQLEPIERSDSSRVTINVITGIVDPNDYPHLDLSLYTKKNIPVFESWIMLHMPDVSICAAEFISGYHRWQAEDYAKEIQKSFGQLSIDVPITYYEPEGYELRWDDKIGYYYVKKENNE